MRIVSLLYFSRMKMQRVVRPEAKYGVIVREMDYCQLPNKDVVEHQAGRMASVNEVGRVMAETSVSRRPSTQILHHLNTKNMLASTAHLLSDHRGRVIRFCRSMFKGRSPVQIFRCPGAGHQFLRRL